MKRSRGRGRRSGGGNNPNKHFESNGPDVKIRGSAQQILDKYQQYARDAQSSGDRVNAENYLQHAEHYYRVLATLKPKPKPEAQDGDTQNGDAADETDSQAKTDSEDGKSRENNRGRNRSRNRRDRDGQTAEAAEEVTAKAKDGTDVEADTVPGSEATEDTPAAEEKPKRRRVSKRRAVEAEASQEGDDGVMKTLSRGRKKATPKADTPVAEGVEASAAED